MRTGLSETAGMAMKRIATEQSKLDAEDHSRSGNLDGALGRDSGPISARNSSKGTLLPEVHAVFRALASAKKISELRIACLTGTLLRQSARETQRRIWQSLDWRYFAWNPLRWVLADLAESATTDVTDPRFVGLAYVHYARRDRLTFDFVTDKLWSLWKKAHGTCVEARLSNS
jgi:hypothetical protein